jgi:hypothetical protein
MKKSTIVLRSLDDSDSDDDELFDDAKDEGDSDGAEKKQKDDQDAGSSNNLSEATPVVAASCGLFDDPFKTQTQTTTTTMSEDSKHAKNSQKTVKNAKICPRLANRGEKCDKKSECQFSHPSRCRHFAKFGIISDFPKGKGCSWESKCRFAHVKVCKKSTCPKVGCNLTHLQPKPVLPSRNQSGSQANHKRVQQRSNQDHMPCAAGSLEKNSEYSSSGLGSRNECSQRPMPNINNTKGVQQSPFLDQGPHALGDLIRTLSTLVAQFQVPQAPQSQHWKQPSQECSRLSPGTLDVGCCQNCRR